MKRISKEHRIEVMLLFFLILIGVMTSIIMFVFRRAISDTIVDAGAESVKYEKHYAFISDDYSDPLMDDIYDGIKTSATKEHAYVEYFGKQLSVTYSVAELLEIAVNAKVDGIFVVGEESDEVKDAINKAVEQNIPVITVFQDCAKSNRQCFVGINGYEVGRLYAKKVLSITRSDKLNVYILVNSKQEDAAKNSVYIGIKEYFRQADAAGISLHGVTIKSKKEFTSDEMIRELILESKDNPDVLICLNEIDTSCAYQTIVDYNKVGEIKILGWGTTEGILHAIKNNTIAAVLTMDAKDMGSAAVTSMMKYEQTGYISPHTTVTTTMVDQRNVLQYEEDKQDE